MGGRLTMQRSEQSWELMRAHGRCTGATIFAIFGGCWFVLSQAYFHKFGWPAISMALSIVTLFLLACLRIQRGQLKPTLPPNLAEQKQRDDRAFGIINGNHLHAGVPALRHPASAQPAELHLSIVRRPGRLAFPADAPELSAPRQLCNRSGDGWVGRVLCPPL